MIIATHSIQAAMQVSTCCALSSNERNLNLRPYHIQHTTVALSTITLTAAHNSYRSNTQQAVPNRTHKASVPATACLYLKFCVLCFLIYVI